MVYCEKIISQLGKNIFPVGQILSPSYAAQIRRQFSGKSSGCALKCLAIS